jgi:hypothetical protein
MLLIPLTLSRPRAGGATRPTVGVGGDAAGGGLGRWKPPNRKSKNPSAYAPSGTAVPAAPAQTIEKVLHRHVERQRKLIKRAGRYAIDGPFVFLELLERNAERVGQHGWVRPASSRRTVKFGSRLTIEAAKENRSGHRDATAILVASRHGLRASAQ